MIFFLLVCSEVPCKERLRRFNALINLTRKEQFLVIESKVRCRWTLLYRCNARRSHLIGRVERTTRHPRLVSVPPFPAPMVSCVTLSAHYASCILNLQVYDPQMFKKIHQTNRAINIIIVVTTCFDNQLISTYQITSLLVQFN